MRKAPKLILHCILSILIGLTLSFPATAGPIVKHEKIVAADGSGDFTTISDA